MDFIVQNIQGIGAAFVLFTGWAVSLYLARYSATKPMKLKIKEEQYSKVYLPIYRYLQKIKSDNPDHILTLSEAQRINSTFQRNFSLVHPEIFIQNEKLLSSLRSGDDCTEIFQKFDRNIESNYENLRRSLGYPSKSYLKRFLRMPPYQKFFFILFIFGTFASILLLFYEIFSFLSIVLSYLSLESFLMIISFGMFPILGLYFLIEKLRGD